MGVRPLGSPIHTEVASCGVKPLNQASVFCSVVPVLPATGRSYRAAAVPVPYCTTAPRVCTAMLEICGSSTRLPTVGSR